MTESVASKTTLESEMKQLKQTADNAVKNKEEAQWKFDKDRAELCATLENYKVHDHRCKCPKYLQLISNKWITGRE